MTKSILGSLGKPSMVSLCHFQQQKITGVTDKGGMKHSPVFRSVTTYPNPLFKIHKLNEEQIHYKKDTDARQYQSSASNHPKM